MQKRLCDTLFMFIQAYKFFFLNAHCDEYNILKGQFDYYYVKFFADDSCSPKKREQTS